MNLRAVVAHQELVAREQRVESDEVHAAEFNSWHRVSPFLFHSGVSERAVAN